MQFAVIGSGSWATALSKILTDSGHNIYWWIRNTETIEFIHKRRHNPHYLSNAHFNTEKVILSASLQYVIENADVVVMAVPSAYAASVLDGLNTDALKGKKIVSAIKGILPEKNELLHQYLAGRFTFSLRNYFTVLGPCHAEEVAAEKLSYLTFSGIDQPVTAAIASHFNTPYLHTITNPDIMGVQYAAVLKNVYALGAGIAHGLDYGDNFLSVYIANAAREMVRFLRVVKHAGAIDMNYSASVYLGDLLVTCYSLYSRNRMFGNMIGKGYSVMAARLELNMVAEGYNASKSIRATNQQVNVDIPMVDIIYEILWEGLPAAEGFTRIEKLLV